MSSNNKFTLALYTVYIVVDGTVYVYPCLSLNHASALEAAAAAHLEACGMLPRPSYARAVGPCRTSGCSCGRISTVELIPETDDLGWTN